MTDHKERLEQLANDSDIDYEAGEMSERDPPDPDKMDTGWHEWKATSFVIYPWTREIHWMDCDCERHGQPSKKVTPEQAYGLVNNGVRTGSCVDGVGKDGELKQ